MGSHVASLSGRHTRRWIWLAAPVAAVVIVGGIGAWSGWRDTGPSAGTDTVTTALPTRTVEAGAVTVKLTPERFDAAGAVVKVEFDTHSVDLDYDVARVARLDVGGVTWPVEGWSGDGPSGHHRAGAVRFRSAGPATGTAILTIDGLSPPVTAAWDLGG
jgi:hypothetical protein